MITYYFRFFPAAGDRVQNNGLRANRGGNGYYWCSTASQITNGYISYFNNLVTNFRDDCQRTYAFSVRCVAQRKLGITAASIVLWLGRPSVPL